MKDIPKSYSDARSETLQRLKDTFGSVSDEKFMRDVEAVFHIDRGSRSTFLGVWGSEAWEH